MFVVRILGWGLRTRIVCNMLIFNKMGNVVFVLRVNNWFGSTCFSTKWTASVVHKRTTFRGRNK